MRGCDEVGEGEEGGEVVRWRNREYKCAFVENRVFSFLFLPQTPLLLGDEIPHAQIARILAGHLEKMWILLGDRPSLDLGLELPA